MTITNGIHSIALTVILIALICPHRIKHLFGLLALCATMMLVASLATNVGVYLFPGDLGRSMPINRIIIYILYPFGDVGSLLLVMMWFERRSKRSN